VKYKIKDLNEPNIKTSLSYMGQDALPILNGKNIYIEKDTNTVVLCRYDNIWFSLTKKEIETYFEKIEE